MAGKLVPPSMHLLGCSLLAINFPPCQTHNQDMTMLHRMMFFTIRTGRSIMMEQ